MENNQHNLLKDKRKETIYSKGFNMLQGNAINYRTVDNTYKRIKVGVKNLDDAVLKLGELKRIIPTLPFHNKHALMKAIIENDGVKMRQFSRFFYKTNGIYAKLC